MKLHGTAPMRADLAGGTLDIYPLYVFLGGAMTLNTAIALTSEVWLETTGGTGIKIISEDLGEEVSAPDAASLDPAKGLDLLARIVRFYNPETGCEIRTKNNVPKGSGLGASSSLLICLSHVMNELTGRRFSAEKIIDIGANLEAQTIRIPTGKQDYYSATYGGVSTIWFDVDGGRREPLISDEGFIKELEERLVITFAGKPRFSGLSNWNMTKAYIDGEPRTVRNFEQIKKTAMEMRECFRGGDLEGFGRLLGVEWENRKGLAEGVTNERIDAMMEAAAGAGAVSSKICGAGGGGCMVSFCGAGAKAAVSKALTAAGADVLDCGISREGVKVEKM